MTEPNHVGNGTQNFKIILLSLKKRGCGIPLIAFTCVIDRVYQFISLTMYKTLSSKFTLTIRANSEEPGVETH